MTQFHEGVWFPNIEFVETIAIRGSYLVPQAQGERGLLESALAQPRQGFDGEYFYPSLSDKGRADLVNHEECSTTATSAPR